jgi:hypothetical protein
MTTAQSADQIVPVKKSTGRNERKARVFARLPGWTLANANAFHVAYSGQPNTALMTFTSTIPIKIGPSDPALPTVSNATNPNAKPSEWKVLSPRDVGSLAVVKAQPAVIPLEDCLLIGGGRIKNCTLTKSWTKSWWGQRVPSPWP